jgi:hypothetical protein
LTGQANDDEQPECELDMKQLAFLAAVFSSVGVINAIEPYDRIKPKLKSEVEALNDTLGKELLKSDCQGDVRRDDVGPKVSFRCGDSVSTDGSGRFYAQGVIFGNFLSPKSQDALVSGWAGETHPSFWGGTLLLTKRQNSWVRVWYKSGIISRHCSKVQLKTGREILLCEEEEGGMGHTYHLLYSLDALAPTTPFERPLVVADSYNDMCVVVQSQSIEQIEVRTQLRKNQGDLTVTVHHGFQRLTGNSLTACIAGKPFPGPSLRTYQLDFLLRDADFQIASWSGDSSRLFTTH